MNSKEDISKQIIIGRMLGQLVFFEYKLNFKFIILSEESYLEDAHDSVLNCGDSNTPLLQSWAYSVLIIIS